MMDVLAMLATFAVAFVLQGALLTAGVVVGGMVLGWLARVVLWVLPEAEVGAPSVPGRAGT